MYPVFQNDNMYQIFQNDNDLVLMIEPQPSAPGEPMFIYDGGDTALLFRDWDSNIRLRGLSTPASTALQAATEICVFEVEGDEIVRHYLAPVRIVSDVRSLIAH